MRKSSIKRVLCRIASLGCALLLLISLIGCGKAVSVPVWNRFMTIGDLDVSYDMLRYFVMKSIYDSENIDPDTLADDPEMQAELEENVYTMLRRVAAYISLADDYGIKLTGQDKSDAKALVKALKEEYGKAAFKDSLAEEYMTENVFYQLSLFSTLSDGVYDYLINEYTSPIRSDDDTVRQDIAGGNWFCAEYIGLTFASDSEDGKREELAQEMLDRAKAGESMSAIVGEYRKIYGLGVVEYVMLDAFTYGEKKQYFEDTILSLEVGEYSEVCEIPNGGYYIAHRLPLEEDYINGHFDKVRAAYLNREIEKILDERAAELEVTVRSKYEDLEFWTME